MALPLLLTVQRRNDLVTVFIAATQYAKTPTRIGRKISFARRHDTCAGSGIMGNTLP